MTGTKTMASTVGTLVVGLAMGLAALAADALAQNKVTMDGSTTVGPIAKAFAEYYMALHPEVKVTVNESGSGNGAKSLVAGTCDIATMSRFMKDDEFKAAVTNGVLPVAHVIAMDGIAVCVHPANPIAKKGLKVEQIRDIFSGKINNWKEVGGPDLKIHRLSRDSSSGTYESFESLVMNKVALAADTETVGSQGQMRTRIQSTQNAIGYLGIGFVDETVRAITVNGIECSEETVASGRYPVARPLFLFTNGYPKLGSHLHAIVSLYLSKKGEEIIRSAGFVPVTKYE